MAGKNISTNFKVITDSYNNYFKENRFTIGNGIPESGDFLVGDIVISNTQLDGIFGWVCIEEGNPGVWEIIGSGLNNGGNNGDEEGAKIVGYVNTVSFSEPVNELSIGISDFNPNTDFLEVHYNGLLLAKDVHYTLNANGRVINAIGEPWNADSVENEQMIFRVMKSAGLNIQEKYNVVNITEATVSVDMGIEGFNERNDILEVHYNGVLLSKGLDYRYNASENKIEKIDQDEPWNADELEDQLMIIKVFKNNNPDTVGSVENNSITLDHLSPELQELLQNGSGASSIGREYNVIVLEEDSDLINMGFETFSSETDLLMVFKNSVYMTEGVDYQIVGQEIQNNDDNIWSAGDEFVFIVLKSIPLVEEDQVINGGNLANSSITMDKLANDIKEAIENASNIDLSGYATKEELNNIDLSGYATKEELNNIDLSGYQPKTDNNLATNAKNLVGAINELFQSANNGKKLIADAIGNALINANSTFKAMSEAILSLRQDVGNETDVKEILYDMMIEDGYKVNVNMSIDELIAALDDSRIDTNTEEIAELDDVKEIIPGETHTYLLKNDGDVLATDIMGEDHFYDPHFKELTSITNIKKVVCGCECTFILKNDGTVWATGYNYYGNLGVGDTEDREIFVNVATNVKDISCGSNHTFIIKNDNTVWACGCNTDGQLGLGDDVDRNTFTKVTTNISNVKKILCGAFHTIMLKNDGTVWSCGHNIGQLGLTDTDSKYTFTQATENISNVKDVVTASCGDHTFMIKNDGTLWGCGNNYHAQVGTGGILNFIKPFTKITDMSGVSQVACGYAHTLVLKNDGTVWSTGWNVYGQLGLGVDNEDIQTFTKINGVSDVKQIACSYYNSFILKNDGTLWVCGRNLYGLTGLDPSDYASESLTTFVQVQYYYDTVTINEYEINRLKLYYYLADNELMVFPTMDIDYMLNLLKEYSFNKALNEYYNNLKIILIDEGVEVSEEDEFNDLIVKIDNLIDSKDEEIAAKEEELANSGGLDIISATSLPATGKENQICVITDNPTDKFILSYEASDHTDESAIFGEMLLKPSSASFTVNSGSISQKHTFFAFSQNGDTKPSYIYQNNNWNTFTPDYFYVVNNSSFNTNVFGDFLEYSNYYSKGDYVRTSSNGLELLNDGGYYACVFRALQNEVDFSLFNKMYIKAYTTTTSTSSQMYLYIGLAKSDSVGNSLVKYGYATSNSLSTGQEYTYIEPFSSFPVKTNNTSIYPIEHTVDISNVNKRGYLVIGNFIGLHTITDLYFY